LKIVNAWLPVVLWAAVIFFLSSVPGLQSGLGAWDWVLRKAAHIFEYGLLMRLIVRAFDLTQPQMPIKHRLVSSGSLALIYAISDEIHQMFVPLRGPSVLDVLIDCVGILCAGWVYWKLKNIKKKYEK
jgi:VanZ family protein